MNHLLDVTRSTALSLISGPVGQSVRKRVEEEQNRSLDSVGITEGKKLKTAKARQKK